MNNTPYQSSHYPSLSQLVEITASDYSKLRNILRERNEIDKFIKWQKGKFIRITNQIYLSPLTSPSGNRTERNLNASNH